MFQVMRYSACVSDDHMDDGNPMYIDTGGTNVKSTMLTYPSHWALYVGTTSKFSLERRHDLISTTFQRCSNVRCPLG